MRSEFMTTYALITTALWLVFIVYWAVSAIGAKKSKHRPWRGIGVRVAIVLVVLLLFRSTSGRRFAASVFISTPGPVIGGIGVVLCATGIGIAIWARSHLGRNWGMPMAVKESPDLVTAGPYAHVRHPIYSGMLLAMLGASMSEGLWWLGFVVVFGTYFIYSASREERTMMREFPTQYPDYKRRTKMLIPGVF
jgi:protein-S-isoprenylcysteine O-methyltransferase Ste14